MNQDLKYAVRILLKNPLVTVVAVVTLALGIGANTAIFSVLNAVVLRPLPYADPDRLVVVWETIAGNDKRSVAPGNFTDWRAQNKSFSDLAATFYGNFNLTSDGPAERINGATVTSNLMSTLGVSARLGRTFQAEDDEHQDQRLAVISDSLWQRRFGGAQDVTGKTITIDEASYTVIGVMPPGFKYPVLSDIWVLGRDRNAVSMSLISQFPKNDWSHERDAHFISVIGRLRPGIGLSQAQSDIAGIAQRLEHAFPATNAGLGSSVIPLHTQIVGNVKALLSILLGAVAFVLLIACTNVASLLLARATQRDREFAIRRAVGASRSRLVRQLLTESVVLSFLGGLVGLGLSVWAVSLFVKLSPGDIPRLEEVSVDLRLLGFTFLVSMLTGLAFGLWPALHATGGSLNQSLKDAGSRASEGKRSLFSRNVLIVTELALAQVLLIGAGLLIASYVRASQIDPGFNPDHVLSAKIAPSAKKYPDPKSRVQFYSQVIEQLRTLPGINSVGMVMNLPLSGASMNRGFSVEGRPEPKPDENVAMDYQVVNSDYFATLDIPILRGRGLTEQDNDTAPRVIVINEAMARRYWPNEDPVGKRMAIGESSKDTSWRTIVGIAGSVRHASLTEEPVPCAFIDYRQDVESWSRMAFVMKTKTDPASLISEVRSSLVAIDPQQPVYAIEPLEKLVEGSVAPRRFVMSLIGSLAFVALTLALVGIYSVISFSVNERTREIGIRMALGANRGDVLRMVLGQGMRVSAIGIVAGLGIAFAVTRLLRTLLFEVSATDPRTFALVVALLTLVALLACYLPARRATRVDPLEALRSE
ncbi:MAG TPA: ABC transporter permease [Pyrinomonadaceae bacterium]|nr:ABC transporter permease [Pyrinomonadaceae bacterium]